MLGGVNIPHTYLSCIKGVFRDSDNRIVSLTSAIDILKHVDTFVIKKTVHTSSGRDIKIVRVGEESSIDKVEDNNIELILEAFGDNFVVQELIRPCDALQNLYPFAINTFRVITYIIDDDIHVCPIALRMGRGKADRDNIHYGGIVIGVNEDGSLKKTAFSEYGERFDAHPDTNSVFEKYKIPGAGNELRETAKRLHSQIPYLGILSWDLTIDQDGMITLVEMNGSGQSTWFCQMVNGEPLFGGDTGRMLNKIRKCK